MEKKLRKIVLIACVSLLMFLSINVSEGMAAPDIKFGLKAGFDISSQWSNEEKIEDDSIVLRSKNGVLFGAMTRFHLSNLFKLQPEIFYVQKGSKQDVTIPGVPIGTVHVAYDLRYLEIPVLLKTYPLKGKGAIQPTLSFGPYFAFLLNGTYSLVNNKIGNFEEEMDDLRKTDMGIVMGSGLELKNDTIEFGFHYRTSMGFVNLALPTGPGAPTVSLRNLNYTVTLEIMI